MLSVRRDPASCLLLRPSDTAVLLGEVRDWGRRCRGAGAVFCVVHREPETFTHVYVVPLHGEGGGTDVLLAGVLAGDRLRDARHWAEATFDLEPSGAAAREGRRLEAAMDEA